MARVENRMGKDTGVLMAKTRHSLPMDYGYHLMREMYLQLSFLFPGVHINPAQLWSSWHPPSCLGWWSVVLVGQ